MSGVRWDGLELGEGIGMEGDAGSGSGIESLGDETKSSGVVLDGGSGVDEDAVSLRD